MILRGREISRDGAIKCMGSIIDSYSRCISRCVRSTLAAEAVACANAIETGIWHRTLITEILFGVFVDSRPSVLGPFSLNNPFDIEKEDVLHAASESSERNETWMIDRERFVETAECCFAHRSSNDILPGGYIYMHEGSNPKPVGPNKEVESKYARFAIQVIALTDCANVYTSAITQQPRTVGKLAKITLSFIRDLADSVHFRFSILILTHPMMGQK